VLSKPVLVKPVPAQPEPVSQLVKRKEAPVQQPFKRRGLTPRAGEKYLQIAAYGPRSLDDYLKTLEKQGMRPLVGPGPAENIYRILIGPLPDAEAVEQTRHLIQSLGIEPILRSY
jgi:cell division septation protein DedD